MGILDTLFSYTPTGYAAEKIGEAIGPYVTTATDQAANIEAIQDFFASATPVNAAASQLKDDWGNWYSTLGFYAKNVDGATLPTAINKKNAFMRANVSSPDELKQVQQVLTADGSIRDPVTGQAKVKTATGDRVVPPQPLIPTQYKVIAAATAAGVTALAILKKLRIL